MELFFSLFFLLFCLSNGVEYVMDPSVWDGEKNGERGERGLSTRRTFDNRAAFSPQTICVGIQLVGGGVGGR